MLAMLEYGSKVVESNEGKGKARAACCLLPLPLPLLHSFLRAVTFHSARDVTDRLFDSEAAVRSSETREERK